MNKEQAISKLNDKINKHTQLIKEYESINSSEYSAEIGYHKKMIKYLSYRKRLILSQGV